MAQLAQLSAAAVIADRAAYAAVRGRTREMMIQLRARRRLRLGDRLIVEFENAETLQYQAQEMIYAEGLSDPAEIAAQLQTYSLLLPDSHQLTATLFVVLDNASTVREELSRLNGVQHTFGIALGGRTVPARELPGPDEPGPSLQTVSVHFLRFTFDDETRDSFRDPAQPASLVVDHPEYAEEVALTGETRRSLLADLALPPSG